MAAPQIFLTVFGIAIGLAGLVMALARTRPKDAGSALSEWLALVGVPAPEWLKNPNTDATAKNWAGLILLISILGAIISGAIWVFSPLEKSIPVSDEEVHGELKPANDPTPPNACTRFGVKATQKAIFLLLGDNVFISDSYGKIVPLQIRGCIAGGLSR